MGLVHQLVPLRRTLQIRQLQSWFGSAMKKGISMLYIKYEHVIMLLFALKCEVNKQDDNTS